MYIQCRLHGTVERCRQKQHFNYIGLIAYILRMYVHTYVCIPKLNQIHQLEVDNDLVFRARVITNQTRLIYIVARQSLSGYYQLLTLSLQIRIFSRCNKGCIELVNSN